MDREQIKYGIQEIGPCTTVQLAQHLCNGNPSPSEYSNIRLKLSRMNKSHEI